jgi:hypothetical protein
MRVHTSTQIAELSYDIVSFLALVNGKLLHAGHGDRGASVTYGDEQGPPLDEFPMSIFGLHVEVVNGKPLYAGVRNGKEFVVYGRSEGRRYDRVCGLSFSPNGSIAYGAKDGKEEFVVVDSVEGKRYPGIWTHTFANGKMLYTADLQRRNPSLHWKENYKLHRECMVFGTEESGPYKAILKDNCRPIIAGDRQIYGALHLNGTCSIIDGSREGKQYHGVGDLTYDPADGVPMYIAIEDERIGPGSCHILVRGTEEVVRQDHIQYASWVNGKPLYVAFAWSEKRSFLIYGSERFDYDFHIGFPEIVNGKLLFVGQTGGYVGDERPFGRFVVYGTTRGETHDDVDSLEIVNGRPLYVACLPTEEHDEDGEPIPRHCVVYGAKRGPIYATITDLTHAGDIPIYRACTDHGSCVVIGDDEGHFFDATFSLRFDPERREATYGAVEGRKVHHIIVRM